MGASDQIQFPVVNDDTLPSIIEDQVARSIGNFDSTLSGARAKEFDYYYGKPFGNEVDGESQVVSTDVADTVEGLLPIILNIFAASDDVVRFDPNGPEDEDMAAQQTEVANYVFYRQNNGFLVLYEWFKDALIQKNGIVKYWWDEKTTKTQERYQGLTDGEYKMLMSDASYISVEELEHTTTEDPAALEARRLMAEEINTKAPPEARPQLMAALAAQPIPQTHDVVLKIEKDVSQIRIQAIPPEEFGISSDHDSVTIQDTPFCYHRTRKTISALREMGCPEDIIQNLAPANEPDITPEALARNRYLDDTWRNQGIANETEVWVTDCYIRVDYDGDGVAELRHIIMPGRTVWINEECDHINFAALTPIIMPHRWIGRSVAELIMDIQFTKSVIWRQQLNNLYLTNNPQKAVLSSAGGIVQANLDDLLTSRAGGILREYQPGAIRHIDTPFVAAASFPMLEYMDAIKENRTGVTRYNQGTDSDSLNKTARGIQMIQAAGAQRTNLIARVFAETGVKELMRGIVYMLSKYSQKSMTLKLRNKWVDVDPREWKTMFNMTVNVGLGTGNRDVQLQHLNLVHQQQVALMQEGRGYMVTDENIWNLNRKSQEAMGFKHPELFITDPNNVPPEAKQPKPDPAAMKVQMDAQEGQAKLKASMQKDQMSVQSEQAIAKLQSDTQIAIAQINATSAERIAQAKLEAEAKLRVFEVSQAAGGEGAKVGAAKAELGVIGKELALQNKEAQLAVDSVVTKAVNDVKNMVAQYETKMMAALQKQETQAAQSAAEGNGAAQSNGSEAKILAMHNELMGGVGQILSGLEAMGKQGKSISFIEQGGKITGAEVRPS